MKKVISKSKQTQGNKKLKQYFEDLCNNKQFISAWKWYKYKSDNKRQKEWL